MSKNKKSDVGYIEYGGKLLLTGAVTVGVKMMTTYLSGFIGQAAAQQLGEKLKEYIKPANLAKLVTHTTDVALTSAEIGAFVHYVSPQKYGEFTVEGLGVHYDAPSA